MKQLNLNYKGRDYQAIISLSGNGVCDISIYRKRWNRKWYQGRWESFGDFCRFFDNIEDLKDTIYEFIVNKVDKMTKQNHFLEEYRKLEDVAFL